MDGRVRETEAYLQHKDGHRLPVIIRVSPLRDASGRIVGAVESFSDNSSKAALLQTIDQLQKESLVDPLTGLENRRYSDMKLQSRIDEMQRYGWPWGVLFHDIDNFKIVNDTFGHNAGDGVLMMVARTLSSNLRADDVCARYGGEEFAVILPRTDVAGATKVAEGIRQRISTKKLINRSTDQDLGKVTVSIGAGQFEFGEPLRSEEHPSELQSLTNLECRLLL